MTDFLFRGSLQDIDPDVLDLIRFETERQFRKLILIPSESTAPQAVREAMGSRFQNIYAEGYPDEETRWMSEEEILDYTRSLTQFRRNSDPRYYKGVEYADIVESLARRRCAEAFAANGLTADEIYANVQPLSGAPANNAVYTALIGPGDTILGMDLLHGGHLTHGSPVNRSGKLFNAAHYTVDPVTERIDYDQVAALAQEVKPKIIIAGYSSYPWVPDWQRFHEIAASVGAHLMTDISHIAGLIAAGAIPSPVGYADIITFTTHKTLTGPRGACILTSDLALARKIDRGVFPGEQGGPHVHIFAALATTFKLARTEQFKKLQHQIIRNCVALTDRLQERGFRIPYGGTNTHLTNLDCKTVTGRDGTKLSGDMGARILDAAGLVTNRNTIPGDKTAANASGIRMGTPWVTQRGLVEKDMVQVADIIADVLQAAQPYSIDTLQGKAARAKVDFGVLEEAKLQVRDLATSAGTDIKPASYGYPHFFYIDDQPDNRQTTVAYDLSGVSVREFADYAFSSDIEALAPGQSQPTQVCTPQGPVTGTLTCVTPDRFRLSVPAAQAALAATWLRDLSDGYVAFDDDPTRRLPGPIFVAASTEPAQPPLEGSPVGTRKPYFIGIDGSSGTPLPPFAWREPEEAALRKTPLHDLHHQMGAKMVPFGGWEMPGWYSSILEEHQATRQAAGLFDVGLMGIFQVEGPDAVAFLDSVCANDIGSLAPGMSIYTHFLDLEANVIDDLIVYYRSEGKFLLGVNAMNTDKDWAWLNAVRAGQVRVDNLRPWVRAFGYQAGLRNLSRPDSGPDRLVDIALQGPRSLDILRSLQASPETRKQILALKRAALCEVTLGGFDLIVSRTGYTGEKIGFELFVHPDRAVELWNALLKAGEPYGLKACGLAARDSLRTEAGLPLYGNELGGSLGLGAGEAGFASYVKVSKPWFIGREAYIEREKSRTRVLARIRFADKGVHVAHPGDSVMDKKGRVIGVITSCALDGEGYLIGQAFIEKKAAAEGTALSIYPGSPAEIGKAPANLKAGDKMTLPALAMVISRFPK